MFKRAIRRAANYGVIIGVLVLLGAAGYGAYAGISRGVGALGRTMGTVNEKINIFNMVDDSLGTMRKMNDAMTEVGCNVCMLSGKLDLIGQTNDLLQEQLAEVQRLNGLMAAQKPLLNRTNTSIAGLKEKLEETLTGVGELSPVIAGLVSSMQGALDVTRQVVDGTSQMVALASQISGLFDSTIGLLARIAPLSAKAKAYMKGDILSRLSSFLPPNMAEAIAQAIAGPVDVPGVQVPQGPVPTPGPVQATVEVVEQVVNDTVETVETTVDTVEQVVAPVVQPVVDPLKDVL